MPTSARNILWWEDSFRVVLVRQFHRHEARRLRCRLHFGETPFGATRQDHSVSLPGRSKISVVCVLPPQRVCHSERRKEGARSRSGHDAMLTATIPDRAAMIGREQSQDSPFSRAEGCGAICPPGAPNRPRLRSDLPVIPPPPSTGHELKKSIFPYMKRSRKHQLIERELRKLRLSVFRPLHGQIKHFFRHVEHS